MSHPRVLVVGHGYLGSPLAEKLFSMGFPLAVFNRSADASSVPFPIITGDVSSLTSVLSSSRQLPFPHPDHIIHCASSSRGGADAYRAVFVEGLSHLQAVFPGVPVIFTSSSSVYGQTDGSIVDENSETSPDRETSRLIIETESIVCSGGGIALRLAGIYGPGRSVHLRKMLDGSATIDEGEPSRFLNQIHRDDAVSAIIHLIGPGTTNQRGAIFNVADDQALTQRECYESLADLLGLPLPHDAQPATDRKRAWTNKIVSNTALRATGWEPRYPSFLDAVKTDERLVPSIREQVAGSIG